VIRLSDLIGQQAVSLATAERTGTVRGIVLDGNRILAVDVGDTTIDASSVRTFDGDVLTYDADGSAPTDRPATNPIGARVLDVHGDQLGLIDDIDITADGDIESIVLDSGDRLVGARLRALGDYAAIVSAELPPPTGPPLGT
jgi:sporulation protein YlmC with PRC-barrel domain